jgi:hypothetical protein
MSGRVRRRVQRPIRIVDRSSPLPRSVRTENAGAVAAAHTVWTRHSDLCLRDVCGKLLFDRALKVRYTTAVA